MRRRTERIVLPLPEGAVLLHPELVRVTWVGVDRSVDIGQLCYPRRDTSSRHPIKHWFDSESYSDARADAVRRLAELASEFRRTGGARPLTVLLSMRCVVGFVNWSDKEGLHQTLCDLGSTESAFTRYAGHLQSLVSTNRKNKNSAANELRDLRRVLAQFFDAAEFASAVPTMRGARKHIERTRVPGEEDQGILMAWCGVLFDVISDSLLRGHAYPFLIDGPAAATGAQQRLWLLPTFQHSSSTQQGTGAWDLATGTIRGYDELKAAFSATTSQFVNQRA